MNKFNFIQLFVCMLFVSCINSPMKETKPDLIKVMYETSHQRSDITYCKEDGSVVAKYNSYGLDTVLYMNPGVTACISMLKKNSKNNISARVSIYVEDIMVEEERDESLASASYKLQENQNP